MPCEVLGISRDIVGIASGVRTLSVFILGYRPWGSVGEPADQLIEEEDPDADDEQEHWEHNDHHDARMEDLSPER